VEYGKTTISSRSVLKEKKQRIARGNIINVSRKRKGKVMKSPPFGRGRGGKTRCGGRVCGTERLYGGKPKITPINGVIGGGGGEEPNVKKTVRKQVAFHRKASTSPQVKGVRED